ncbi:DC1 domain-containing protein [Dioscorea alata]|uniref:DC1 domain-containing protein n=1 Tax=Dioscorea alata TaxID=55571 RepID=A0ACB7WAI2_DIOAL|nr:DC1 domain-containing protein [Dioscorea alata]
MKLDVKELWHGSHPQHVLRMEYTEIPFRCDGCKEAGIGIKYSCDACCFDLHRNCALAPSTITHPFYDKCYFQFYTRPPGSAMRVCDACRKDVLGFVYHCTGCGFDLHPCCANLAPRLEDGDRSFLLCMKITSSCHRCGLKGPGWSYRSECKNYNLHVSCVKELLVESWQAMYLNLDKEKVRDIQTKIPSLRGTMQSHQHQHHHLQAQRARLGKVHQCCQIAGGAIRIIISAILGDPTAIIAAVIGGFISK